MKSKNSMTTASDFSFNLEVFDESIIEDETCCFQYDPEKKCRAYNGKQDSPRPKQKKIFIDVKMSVEIDETVLEILRI